MTAGSGKIDINGRNFEDYFPSVPLRRDPRMKERKKSGQPGARKRFQFSKR